MSTGVVDDDPTDTVTVPDTETIELQPASAAYVSTVGTASSAAVGPSPASLPHAPLQTAADWTLLGWMRRTFFNRPPTVEYDISLNAQDMSNGVIIGNIGAVDPDGDQLSYKLIAGSPYGTVVIDQLTGDFTFTPTLSFARAGGTTAFTVRVSDNRFHLLSYLFSPDRGSPIARIAVPVVSVADPASSPALEAFEVEKVIEFELPDGVKVTGADLSPDGEQIILEVEVADGSTQIAVTNLDGGDYQCLSCGLVPNATKIKALYDNQRIWFASTNGQQSADDPLGGAGAITYMVLECGTSLHSCGQPTVKKVTFPSDRGLRRLLPTQNREAKPDPYGEYVTWTEVSFFTGPRMSIAKLVPTDGGYELVEQRVFSPQWYEDTNYAVDFANATRFYEGASWNAGGRYLKYQTTSDGLNYDIYLLDTATGERRQLTTDLDYNESGAMSPDGMSMYFSSARGLDRMDVFTALVRPSLLDVVAFPQIGRVSLWNNRRSMNEPWLMNLEAGQQVGGYSGQPIIIDPDWTIRGWSWFPDSTRALINEQQRPDTVTAGAPDTPWRISIISFPSRTATTPLPPVHQDPEAIATWSVPVKDYKPMIGRTETRVLKGTHSGTATLRYSGIFALGTYSVTYKDYSDDGKTFINGTEKVKIKNPMGNSVWSADLTSTGERTGYLTGKINIGKSNEFSGEVSSEINGVTYSGIPTQTDSPVIGQPQLAISSSGDRVQVTATVAEDGQPRPVRGVAVTVGSVTTTTDEQGYAQIALSPGDTITAVAGGFQTASQQVPSL
ncbi:Ig-like domain-containing protein [Mycolicibacterium hippocampi]|nr:Ig-like domain-containing protein [Mycolicibacterium hippocampi]